MYFLVAIAVLVFTGAGVSVEKPREYRLLRAEVSHGGRLIKQPVNMAALLDHAEHALQQLSGPGVHYAPNDITVIIERHPELKNLLAEYASAGERLHRTARLVMADSEKERTRVSLLDRASSLHGQLQAATALDTSMMAKDSRDSNTSITDCDSCMRHHEYCYETNSCNETEWKQYQLCFDDDKFENCLDNATDSNSSTSSGTDTTNTTAGTTAGTTASTTASTTAGTTQASSSWTKALPDTKTAVKGTADMLEVVNESILWIEEVVEEREKERHKDVDEDDSKRIKAKIAEVPENFKKVKESLASARKSIEAVLMDTNFTDDSGGRKALGDDGSGIIGALKHAEEGRYLADILKKDTESMTKLIIDTLSQKVHGIKEEATKCEELNLAVKDQLEKIGTTSPDPSPPPTTGPSPPPTTDPAPDPTPDPSPDPMPDPSPAPTPDYSP
eukprot:gnl/TRDRNA2_/TRDRNA2_176156_c2_seq2.p1 gnl/TRDRNA2_/TRDRNA2_176156_c2~~gnl/TRDRNA2_/TRDRNA2_176156_c2_seq2.p1  ORF type:complete len:446 (+),score=98.82 gnl/TRDRNA2_/TRDRNA2_176156_c2_seq2:57-1394(+)